MNFLTPLSRRVPWLSVLAGLSVALLLLMQYHWLRHSRRLIEEQFDQKVTMAICSAVESLSRDQASSTDAPLCSTPAGHATHCAPLTMMEESAFQAALDRSMQRYDIDYDFTFAILPEKSNTPLPPDKYCSPLAAFGTEEGETEGQIQLEVLGKESYLNQRMSFMMISGILIALLIAGIFGTSLRQLSAQRKLHTETVDFFNHSAHEFRTPLANILLSLSRWRKRDLHIMEDRYFRIIEDESRRMQDQVRYMLKVAPNTESPIMEMDARELVLADVLREVEREMKIQVEQAGGELLLEVEDSAAFSPIMGDRLHLGNLLRNLIANAIRYSRRSPRIKLQLYREGPNLLLTVHDNGIGIAPAEREIIFACRERGQNGKGEGYGIGLSYVRKVARSHGGSIRLLRSSPAGSIFELSLPAKEIAHVHV